MIKAAPNYVVTPLRVVLGIVTGAFLGVTIVAIQYLWGTYELHGVDYGREYAFTPTRTVFLVALIVWSLGFVVLALPLWGLLHNFGYRHWLHALIMGGCVTFFVAFGLSSYAFGTFLLSADSTFSAADSGGPTVIDSTLTLHGWWSSVVAALEFSVVGALVAFVIWRVAYRSVRGTSSAP